MNINAYTEVGIGYARAINDRLSVGGKLIYYYTYSITEAKVDGYTTTIDKSQDGFTFTITNRHFPGLPDTGGYGSYLIYLIAVLLFLVYFVMRYKKCKKNKKAEKL